MDQAAPPAWQGLRLPCVHGLMGRPCLRRDGRRGPAQGTEEVEAPPRARPWVATRVQRAGRAARGGSVGGPCRGGREIPSGVVLPCRASSRSRRVWPPARRPQGLAVKGRPEGRSLSEWYVYRAVFHGVYTRSRVERFHLRPWGSVLGAVAGRVGDGNVGVGVLSSLTQGMYVV